MKEKHYTENLSAFLHHELPKEERQTIAEHLLQCEKCRNEHDEIKLGAALASRLQRADAPANLWRGIENNLRGKEKSQTSLLQHFSFFGARRFAAVCISFGVVIVFVMGIVNLLIKQSPETSEQTTPIFREDKGQSVAVQTPTEFLTNQNIIAQIGSNLNSNVQNQQSNLNVQTPPKTVSPQSVKEPSQTIARQNDLPAWNVETIAGTPKAGNQTVAEKGKLTVGEFLETDARSRAKIEVANIGQVELAPNSRVKLVKTRSTEHRLALERGVLQAKIFAPPRLFIVDTPSAVAVDLGCEYTLEVDKDGNSRLHVTAGFVALELGQRESIVPAGAICLTRKGKGVGTPFFDDVSSEFQTALTRFDFEGGGSDALETIFKEARAYDSLTLWHLLSRTENADREKIFDRLISFVKLPPGATREGVLKLDKKMLESWRAEIEKLWFE